MVCYLFSGKASWLTTMQQEMFEEAFGDFQRMDLIPGGLLGGSVMVVYI